MVVDWISIYNACLLKGINIHPKDIIWFCEMNNELLFNGGLGIMPRTVIDFFSSISVNVKLEGMISQSNFVFGGLNIDLNQIAKDYPAIILCYWHGKGAHYVAASWDNITSLYLVYNHYSDKTSIYYYSSLTDFWADGYRVIGCYAIGDKIT